MSLEDQIRQHKEISLKIEELEAQKKALGQEILRAMEGKSLQVKGYLVKRFSRVSISSTIDQARLFHATKMEEVVDKERLKALFKSGTPVPGIKVIEYIQITGKSSH